MNVLTAVVAILVLAPPVICFAAVVAAFAHATDLPRRAPPRLARTWGALGVAFLFVPLAVLLEVFAPSDPRVPYGTGTPHWAVAVPCYVMILASPIVLRRSWIGRIAPTTAIARLVTTAGFAAAFEFVLLTAVSRWLIGCDL